jgi:hypothetical protein
VAALCLYIDRAFVEPPMAGKFALNASNLAAFVE